MFLLDRYTYEVRTRDKRTHISDDLRTTHGAAESAAHKYVEQLPDNSFPVHVRIIRVFVDAKTGAPLKRARGTNEV